MSEKSLVNWRFPYFAIASDFELSSSSESRMFWDGITTAALFDSALWADDTALGAGYWHLEPALSGGTFTYGGHSEARYHGELANGIRYGRLSARQLLHIDSRYEDDPYYPAHQGRAFRGRIEEAVLQADWKHGFLRFGRMNRAWGPFPDRSLVLSSHPYTYDAIEGQITSGLFEFRHLFAAFSSNRASLDSDIGEAYNRYLTAHSLTVMVGRWVTFGLTEAVLFTRRGTTPDFGYINPVSVYSVTNTNWEGDGNLMLGCQWNVHPGTEDVSFRGQLMFDDFQVDDEIATDKEPAHWALDAGIFLRDPFKNIRMRHLLKVECLYASEWMYTVPDENAGRAERYIHNRRSLGLPGNDSMKISVAAIFVPEKPLCAGIHCSFEKHGANTPLTSWADLNAVRGLPVSDNAPDVRRWSGGLSMLLHYRHLLSGNFKAELGWIKNEGNIRRGNISFDPLISSDVSIYYGKNLFSFKD